MGHGKVDKLDTAVIRGLAYGSETFQWDIRASFAKIARELEVDEDTVRARVRRLEDEGVITGWNSLVHPRLLGRESASIEVEAIPDKHKGKAIESLRLLDGVYAIFDHYRSGLFVVVFIEPGGALERLTELVATICGARAEAWPTALPPVTHEPDAGDWRLIRAMHNDPRQSIGDLASSVGMSARTVQRRLGKIIEGRAVFVSLRIDFSKMKHLVPVQVRVVYSDTGDRDEVRRVLTDHPNVVFSNLEGSLAVVSYMMESLSEKERLRRRLEQLSGVQKARVDVQMDRIIADDWVDDAIAARCKSSG